MRGGIEMSKIDTKAPTSIDFEKEGLMCGLEFHQQVYAPYDDREISKLHGSKLFCSCPAVIREDDPDFQLPDMRIRFHGCIKVELLNT